MHQAISILLALVPQGHAPTSADTDSDGDGLSDFQEIHKYFTDPENLRINWEGCEAAVGAFAI